MERNPKMRSNRNLTVVEKKLYPIYNPLMNSIKRNSIATFDLFLSNYKMISPENILAILTKSKKLRMDVENRMVGEYLSKKFKYFKKIKSENKLGFLKLIPFLKYDKRKKDEIIINIGDENNNLYVIFEGTVILYKEVKKKSNKPLHNIRDYLKDLFNKDKDRYNYIKRKNQDLELDLDNLIKEDFAQGDLNMNKTYNFYYEQLEEVGTFSEGYAFGETELIKKTNREVVIKSVTDCKLIYMNKFDYNRILKTPEEKVLEKKADKFIKNFPLFKNWSMEQLVKLFNYFVHEIHYRDEFIFKQNDSNEYLYFLEEGGVVQYANISFSWFNEYIEYIKDFNNNLLDILLNLKYKKHNNDNAEDVHIYINEKIEKIKNEYKKKLYRNKYPFLNINKIYAQRRKDLVDLSELFGNEKNEENFFKIKFEEGDLNNPENLYKIQICSIKTPAIFGFEEIFEVKNRLTSVECVSDQVNVIKIKINDLLNILYTYKDYDYIETFMELMIQKKSILVNSIQTQIKKYGIEFQKSMENKYDKIITKPNIMTIKEDKSIIVDEKLQDEAIVSLRLKGWNNGLYLDNILDSNICLIKPGTKKQIKKEEKKRSKTLNFLYNIKTFTNEKKLKSTIYSFDKFFDKSKIEFQKSMKTSKFIGTPFINLKNMSIKQQHSKHIKKVFFKTNVPFIDNERYLFEQIQNKSNIKDNKKYKNNFISKTINTNNDYSPSNFSKIKKRVFKKMINYKISEENKDETNKEKTKSDNEYGYSNLNSGSLWTKSRDVDYLPSII